MVGNPAEEILKYIDSHAVDLVLMSTHGHSGIKEWVDIGSVASKVLHASRVPVWLVPSELRDEIVSDTLPKRTLVVPLSGTRMSEAAIPHALNIARQRGADAEIVLVGVLDAGLISVSRAQARDQEDAYNALKEYLVKTADSLSQSGLAVRTEVLVGLPAESIIEYLKANPPQLLCMATRDRSSISRFVFGSVAENVIHMIKKTPMLLVSSAE
jgi:nucleotide-binding universal stress UspA family protein